MDQLANNTPNRLEVSPVKRNEERAAARRMLAYELTKLRDSEFECAQKRVPR